MPAPPATTNVSMGPVTMKALDVKLTDEIQRWILNTVKCRKKPVTTR